METDWSQRPSECVYVCVLVLGDSASLLRNTESEAAGAADAHWLFSRLGQFEGVQRGRERVRYNRGEITGTPANTRSDHWTVMDKWVDFPNSSPWKGREQELNCTVASEHQWNMWVISVFQLHSCKKTTDVMVLFCLISHGSVHHTSLSIISRAWSSQTPRFFHFFFL